MTTSAKMDDAKCGYCKGWHLGPCPYVKAIEFHPDGSVRRVEFRDYGTAMLADAPNPIPPATCGA